MRKIYSILALLIATLAPLAASAVSRTVKIHIDEPSRITEIKCGDYGVDKVYTIGEDNCIEVNFGDNKDNGDIKQLNIYVIPDARIVSMKYEDGTAPAYDGAYAWGNPLSLYSEGKYAYFTGYGGSYNGFGVKDGTTLNLETKVLPSKILTFKGNADQMSVQKYNNSTYKYEDAAPKEDGVWEFNGNGEDNVKVLAKDGFLISSISYIEGEETGVVSSTTMVTDKILYSKDYSGDTSFTIATIAEEDARTAAITLKMAPGADVAIKRNGKEIALTNDAEQTIKFNPLNDEKSFTVTRKSDATRKLYQVTFTPAAEGDAAPAPAPQTANSVASFTFTATNGGVLEVNPEFPDIDVPVHFTFVNEGTEASITSVKVNGVALEDGAWLANNFSVKLSDKVELVQDTENYEFKGSWISVNGTASSNASFEVLDSEVEGGYTVAITSRKYVTKKVTIIAPALKYLNVQIATEVGWNYVYTPIEFNEECVAEVEIKETATRIQFDTKTGLYNYISRKVIDDATGEVVDMGYGASDGRVANTKIYDGMTLRCVVEKKRTEKARFYLEDTNWSSNDIKLEAGDVFEEAVALEPGEYTEVTFAKVNDKTPNEFSAETFKSLMGGDKTPVIYVNDVKLAMEDSALAGIKAGDLVKVYSEEKEPVTVQYSIEEGVNVTVAHDKTTLIETPASHQMLPGTHICITPIASAADDDETAKVLKVSCNDVNVDADENGVFVVKPKANSVIKVYMGIPTGVSEISDEDECAPVYDLQGRRVSNTAKGLVISGGKVRIRK